MKGNNYLRQIDRTVLTIVAFLIIANSLYLVSPWYGNTYPEGHKAPLHTLFVHKELVITYGVVLFVNSALLLWGIFSKFNRQVVLSYTLLVAFLMRLYAVIGTFVVLDQWLPPSYLPLLSTVAITGAYYIWVQRHAKSSQ